MIRLMLIMPIVFVFGFQQDADSAWERFIRENLALQDSAAALRQIAEREAELKRDLSMNRVRLAELQVRCRIPRVPPIQMGTAASEAIRLLEEEIAARPDHRYARYLLGRTCLGLPRSFKRRDLGLAQFRWLAAHEQKVRGSAPYPDVFLELAEEEANAGRTQRATEIVAAGRVSFPDDPELRELAIRLAAGPPKGDLRAATNALHAALRKGSLEFESLDKSLREAGNASVLQRAILRLWLLEASRGDATAAAVGRTADEAIEFLEKARKLDPADSRIDGWLGSMKTAMGMRSADKDLEREGWELLDRGATLHPEFNVFVRALSRYDQMGLVPETDRASVAASIEGDLYRTVEMSTGGKMDRTRFLSPDLVNPSTRVAAGDSARAPYTRSGTFFWAGEFFRERKDWRKATDAFGEALRLDPRRSWPYRELAESRRIYSEATLKGELPKAAPLTSPVSCLLCHRAE